MKISIRNFLIMVVILATINIILFSTDACADNNDSDFSRPLYSLQYVNEHDVGVTFNSIKLADTDAEWAKKNNLELPLLTNETNFVGAREYTGKNEGAKNVWEGTEITAEDGKEYIVRLYVHNNSQKQEAKDVQVRFYVPYGSASSQTVDGWLTSSNATPNTYLDDVTFKSADGAPFHLEYVTGSALLENGSFAKGAGVQLPDSITNQGNPTNEAEDEWTLIGYDALDGRIPGCYQYINYVTIRVKVVYDYVFSLETKVRLADNEDKTWKETVEAKVGDKVEFQIHYQNTSSEWQEHVSIRDILPSNLRYIEGSTKLMNANHPNGDSVNEDYLVGDGLKIGSYSPKANAYILFTAEVVDDNLACGKNTLVNWGQAGVDSTTLQDSASVVVHKNVAVEIAIRVCSVLIFVCLTGVVLMLVRIFRRHPS